MLELIKESSALASAEERMGWQSCTILEAVYQPGRSCRIAYALGEDEDEDRRVLFYARWDPESRFHVSAVRLSASGDSFEVYRYPRDRRMKQIRSMHRSTWLREASEKWFSQQRGGGRFADRGWRCTPLKYVPESRLVCRLKGVWNYNDSEEWVRAYVRVTRRNEAENQFVTLSRIHESLTKGSAPLDVPRPLGVIPSRHLLATEFVRGKSLKELAQEGAGDEVASICRRLASLHRYCPHVIDARGASSSELQHEMLFELSYGSRERGELCRELQSWCASQAPMHDTAGLVHGDLHSGQIILRGSRVCVIDWDRATLGDGTQDILNLALDFSEAPWLQTGEVSKGVELASACISAWRSTGGPWNSRAARWLAVRSLVLRAWGLMRHLRPDWPSATRRLLERALQVWQHGLQFEEA
jgi:tRNA A-37 threonylcarbamoyl transferase component Bud32